MINFKAFKIAREKYTAYEMPLMTEMREWASEKMPYKGLTILHNIPLTIEAVLKIEILLIGGADVTASCIKSLSPNEDALSILEKAQVKIQIAHKFENDYDFCLDCCGELAYLNPRLGFVELTQTGSEIYKKLNTCSPIVSIDDSKLKFLETLFGTGNGFVRALITLTKIPVYDKKFVIFGFGKVGKGIAHALIKFTDDITVIDIDENILKLASKRGLKVINGAEKNEILDVLKKAYCIVTASGIKNLLSDYYGFSKSDFPDALLTNMGADDEYGNNFLHEEILFEKKPLNFAIPEPTTMKYLDPILYAHNLGINLILSNKLQPGYNSFPDEAAKTILNKWSIFHKENIMDMEEYIF